MFLGHTPTDITVHPYRTARVDDIFLRLPRDMMQEFEANLAVLADHGVDNHTVYEITQTISGGLPRTTYVEFSDFSVNFGHECRKGRW